MATLPPAGRAGDPRAADRSDGERPSVVHITAEYYPYARTGGLAEAVPAWPASSRPPGSMSSRSCRSTGRFGT